MVSSDAIVVWLENVRKDDVHIVGGKCANLGELTAKGVTVPPGFAVTADAFRRFLEETRGSLGRNPENYRVGTDAC